MAFKVIEIVHRNFNGAKKTYQCTSEDDVAKLPRHDIPGTQEGSDFDNAPCGYGSVALIVKGGETIVKTLDPENNWVDM